MTDTAVVPVAPATGLPAAVDPLDADYMVGMEDFDQSDIVMPEIKIDHKEGVFVDSLSGEKFAVLDCVILGLVKNRVMWDKEVSDDPPLCQSLNFTEGRPGKEYPWSKTGFVKAPDHGGEGEPQQILSCEACPLKEWGTHPTRDVPWCAERHTYVIGLPVSDGSSFAPAIISFASSGIKGSKAYLSGYARAKTPTFVNRTTIRLDQLKRGSVDYCVPKFEKGAPVDPSFFGDFAAQFRTTRHFLHTPRRAEAVEGISEGTVATAPMSPATGDEMPF